MILLPGPPPAPIWQWVFDNLGELGFRYDAEIGGRRGKFRGKPIFLFAAEPFQARIDGGGSMDFCELIAEMDGTSAGEIRKKFREAYERAQGWSSPQPQGSGDPYSKLASETRKEFGYR